MKTEYPICVRFGCSRKLSLLEQLCGDLCHEHNNNGKTIYTMNTTTISKAEAIKALEAGNTLRHVLFLPEQHISLTIKGDICFEDNVKISAEVFWADRISDAWNTGWSII